MNRRDFLSLRTDPRGQILELSCERLYMRLLDAGIAADVQTDGDAWEGEPPAVIERRTPADLMRELDRDLSHADVLRIVDRQWLAHDELGRQIDSLVSAFRARGGRVELP